MDDGMEWMEWMDGCFPGGWGGGFILIGDFLFDPSMR